MSEKLNLEKKLLLPITVISKSYLCNDKISKKEIEIYNKEFEETIGETIGKILTNNENIKLLWTSSDGKMIINFDISLRK